LITSNVLQRTCAGPEKRKFPASGCNRRWRLDVLMERRTALHDCHHGCTEYTHESPSSARFIDLYARASTYNPPRPKT